MKIPTFLVSPMKSSWFETGRDTKKHHLKILFQMLVLKQITLIYNTDYGTNRFYPQNILLIFINVGLIVSFYYQNRHDYLPHVQPVVLRYHVVWAMFSIVVWAFTIYPVIDELYLVLAAQATSWMVMLVIRVYTRHSDYASMTILGMPLGVARLSLDDYEQWVATGVIPTKIPDNGLELSSVAKAVELLQSQNKKRVKLSDLVAAVGEATNRQIVARQNDYSNALQHTEEIDDVPMKPLNTGAPAGEDKSVGGAVEEETGNFQSYFQKNEEELMIVEGDIVQMDTVQATELVDLLAPRDVIVAVRHVHVDVLAQLARAEVPLRRRNRRGVRVQHREIAAQPLEDHLALPVARELAPADMYAATGQHRYLQHEVLQHVRADQPGGLRVRVVGDLFDLLLEARLQLPRSDGRLHDVEERLAVGREPHLVAAVVRGEGVEVGARQHVRVVGPAWPRAVDNAGRKQERAAHLQHDAVRGGQHRARPRHQADRHVLVLAKDPVLVHLARQPPCGKLATLSGGVVHQQSEAARRQGAPQVQSDELPLEIFPQHEGVRAHVSAQARTLQQDALPQPLLALGSVRGEELRGQRRRLRQDRRHGEVSLLRDIVLVEVARFPHAREMHQHVEVAPAQPVHVAPGARPLQPG
eukprot:CAMPEP_0173063100 /NCGR_PEP_ID=MMETSP1102-20130122/4188_1 /TAXON_ID=49646 /ORGANISM="Geminigera sp., Strain Caron Lab Isolate" /LENGTH=640 /DNA_ID=CAMNT_0013929849 /DNA_START=877 /DNA_END=2796 /DNA_ORIENTATION=-